MARLESRSAIPPHLNNTAALAAGTSAGRSTAPSASKHPTARAPRWLKGGAGGPVCSPSSLRGPARHSSFCQPGEARPARPSRALQLLPGRRLAHPAPPLGPGGCAGGRDSSGSGSRATARPAGQRSMAVHALNVLGALPCRGRLGSGGRARGGGLGDRAATRSWGWRRWAGGGQGGRGAAMVARCHRPSARSSGRPTTSTVLYSSKPVV